MLNFTHRVLRVSILSRAFIQDAQYTTIPSLEKYERDILKWLIGREMKPLKKRERGKRKFRETKRRELSRERIIRLRESNWLAPGDKGGEGGGGRCV